MTTNATHIAKELLEIKAVALRPDDYFTWTSGIKSPIYCDNRLTMSYPTVRRQIANGLVALIQQHFPDTTVIAGTATAGIPHAAWVSERLDLPMVYVRDAKKKHGKTNQIEGRVQLGDKVVVVEDLISTGKSSITVVEALREAGCEVLGVVAIFSYLLPKATQAFAEVDVPVYTLTHYDALLEEATNQGIIQASDIETLVAWRDTLGA